MFIKIMDIACLVMIGLILLMQLMIALPLMLTIFIEPVFPAIIMFILGTLHLVVVVYMFKGPTFELIDNILN